jgi:hypothetical protein
MGPFDVSNTSSTVILFSETLGKKRTNFLLVFLGLRITGFRGGAVTGTGKTPRHSPAALRRKRRHPSFREMWRKMISLFVRKGQISMVATMDLHAIGEGFPVREGTSTFFRTTWNPWTQSRLTLPTCTGRPACLDSCLTRRSSAKWLFKKKPMPK